ncbi:MAG: hypothetical protein GY913_00940 [Proteobacteria bacterium]|nr:hypothetical protein [Pseudomonadota bacterium]
MLIASPQMRDSNFSGAVVLLWHFDDEGAMGVVINRAMEIGISDVGKQLEIDAEELADPSLADHVLWGGPVEPGAGFLLLRGTVPDAEGWNLDAGIAVTTSQDRLERLLRRGGEYRLCLGYAGWAAGQLDAEIALGSWLYTEVDPELVFDGQIGDRYDKALMLLGLQSSMVWMTPIDE